MGRGALVEGPQSGLGCVGRRRCVDDHTDLRHADGGERPAACGSGPENASTEVVSGKCLTDADHRLMGCAGLLDLGRALGDRGPVALGD
jgi:hypothetical protein